MGSDNPSLSWAHVFVRVGLNAATHPLEYAKLLIQIGHEPLPPYKARTIFGREKLFYPNIFSYIKHIKKRDGLSGCFRGLAPRLAENVCSGLAFQATTERITFKELDEPNMDNSLLTEQERNQRFLQNTMRETIGRVASVVVSHPFHVIAVRTMAQFIGEDECYTGIFASVTFIYKTNGIFDLFSGLTPRLINEVGALWLGNILVHLVENYLVEDKDIKGHIGAAMRFLANAIMYPMGVVSNCMAITGSGIVAGRPPCMPEYTDWMNCYRHLKDTKCLKRGSSLLFRAYMGPTIMGESGVVIPVNDMFKSPVD